MNALTIFANAGLMASSFNGYRRWNRSARHVGETQRDVLLTILRRNVETSFGKAYRFDAIDSVHDFQQRVPLGTYADFAPYIERIATGERNVLVADPVLRFELSSGSTSASKLIPYTSSLKSEFQRGLNPWLYSLYASYPALLTGRQYWSVTPIGQKQIRTSGGIPIGFEEDSEYFGSFKRTFIRKLMAVPSAVSRITDIEVFRYVTMRFLLQCRDLTFISVWNPTFLALLFDTAVSRMDDLIADIANGTLTAELDQGLRLELGRLRADPDRAEDIKAVIKASRDAVSWETIWPSLSLISCWADASASCHATQLQKHFPTVAIQPKGLLATEGFITFPIVSGGGALSVNSHFFEFAEVSDSGEIGLIKLADELELGRSYSVIITTSGGLYRYRLKDVVEVIGSVGNGCPVLRFIGKEGSVVDLFGEKLNEYHVRKLLNEAMGSLGIEPSFAMMAPEEKNGDPAHYVLFIQASGLDEEESLRELAVRVESGLRENYHYRYCRMLGQLALLRIFIIQQERCDAANLYVRTCTSLGQRLGNIKSTTLHSYRGWANVFPGRFL